MQRWRRRPRRRWRRMRTSKMKTLSWKILSRPSSTPCGVSTSQPQPETRGRLKMKSLWQIKFKKTLATNPNACLEFGDVSLACSSLAWCTSTGLAVSWGKGTSLFKTTQLDHIFNAILFSRMAKKALYKVAFHGGFNNIWSSLMTIPEVRSWFSFLTIPEESDHLPYLR